MSAGPIRSEQGRQRRIKFLALVGEGMTYKEAGFAVGWNNDAARMWNFKKHPDFKAKCDYLRWQGRKPMGRNTVVNPEDPDDFSSFTQAWFPERRPHLPHQLQIANTLDDLGPRDVVMFLLWPEAGKTATLEDYICRKLAFHPDHRFRYVSEASDLSKRVIGTVQRRLTDESEWGPFIRKYGPFYEKGQERNGRPWTTEQITLINNVSGERDRNLVASSWTSAVYGSRIDTLVLDDLQSQRNYVQAEEIFRRIRGTFFNRGLQMRTLIIGTRIGPGDFYERMIDAGLITKQIVLPAEDPATGEPTAPLFWDQDMAYERGLTRMVHNGGACCKGFRECPRDHSTLTPKEFMGLIKHQSGAETWHASYQQNPAANERTTFSEWIDKCLDHDRPYGKLSAA